MYRLLFFSAIAVLVSSLESAVFGSSMLFLSLLSTLVFFSPYQWDALSFSLAGGLFLDLFLPFQGFSSLLFVLLAFCLILFSRTVFTNRSAVAFFGFGCCAFFLWFIFFSLRAFLGSFANADLFAAPFFSFPGMALVMFLFLSYILLLLFWYWAGTRFFSMKRAFAIIS